MREIWILILSFACKESPFLDVNREDYGQLCVEEYSIYVFISHYLPLQALLTLSFSVSDFFIHHSSNFYFSSSFLLVSS
jgi:hypothetical protein